MYESWVYTKGARRNLFHLAPTQVPEQCFMLIETWVTTSFQKSDAPFECRVNGWLPPIYLRMLDRLNSFPMWKFLRICRFFWKNVKFNEVRNKFIYYYLGKRYSFSKNTSLKLDFNWLLKVKNYRKRQNFGAFWEYCS